LIAAIKEAFPHVERRECFRHLIQNYIKNFCGKELMYHASRAYRREVYEHNLANVAVIDGVSAWLKANHKGL
jgi:hypothetical protein